MNWPSIAELEKCLPEEDMDFEQWARSVPDKHWAKYDISALRIGLELGKRVAESS